MAITHVKVTYSVQARTAQRVAELSSRWGVPKSEVIRRVIDEAATGKSTLPKKLTPIEVIERLMSTPSRMKPGEAEAWTREIRRSRRASGHKRGTQLENAWKKYKKGLAER